MKAKVLYAVVLQEKNNRNCTRTVHVTANNFNHASDKAKRANPNNLYLPKAVSVERVGPVF